jgi:DNA-binding NarL/FixJ family response regulator
MERYPIVLADDHMLFREGLKRIIEAYPDLEVVGEVNDGLKLLAFLKKSPPKMVLLDISMPNLQGIEATKEIKMLCPEVKVLILTMHKSKEHLYRAISAGADGYLLKEDAHSDLINAIKTVRDGGSFISPLIGEQMTDIFVQKCRGKFESPTGPLTSREIQILQLVAEGKTSREIAELLFISMMTVQNHRTNIKKKLNIKKNADLVKYAIEKGYTSTSSTS